MTNPKQIIAFVLYPGFTPLELIGTATSLHAANMSRYEMAIVGERIEPVASDTPLQFIPGKTFDEVQQPSIVVVPGAGDKPLEALENRSLTAYVRQVAATADMVVGVSTGALVLGAAGLLDGREATTHWAYAALLRHLGARYVRKPWVESGSIITAAGISGAVDVGLALAARVASLAVSKGLQLSMEYDPEPPFGLIDWRGVSEADFATVLPSDRAAELNAALGRIAPTMSALTEPEYN